MMGIYLTDRDHGYRMLIQGLRWISLHHMCSRTSLESIQQEWFCGLGTQNHRHDGPDTIYHKSPTDARVVACFEERNEEHFGGGSTRRKFNMVDAYFLCIGISRM